MVDDAREDGSTSGRSSRLGSTSRPPPTITRTAPTPEGTPNDTPEEETDCNVKDLKDCLVVDGSFINIIPVAHRYDKPVVCVSIIAFCVPRAPLDYLSRRSDFVAHDH